MATGNNQEHNQGIERETSVVLFCSLVLNVITESGNMLIMAYAHAKRTGDISLLSQHVRVQSVFTIPKSLN